MDLFNKQDVFKVVEELKNMNQANIECFEFYTIADNAIVKALKSVALFQITIDPILYFIRNPFNRPISENVFSFNVEESNNYAP